MFKQSFLALAIISVLATGCSSGGTDPAVDTTRTIDGSVAKGIIKYGIVTASVDGVEVGNAVTNVDGEYTLTLNDSYDGVSPILIELTATQGADVPDDEKTMMVCDASTGCGTGIAFGDDIPLHGEDTFELKAYSPSVASGGDVTASITPFTSMAAARVEAGATIDNDSVFVANKEIGQIVGSDVDILNTKPVNIDGGLGEGDAAQKQYTIMLAALAKQAFKDSGTDGVVDLDDVIANLAAFNTDAEDQEIGNNGGLSLTDLFTDADSEAQEAVDSGLMEQADADSTASFTTTLSTVIADNGGTLTPEASSENADEVTQAKALVSEVRTWVTDIESLENPTNALLDDAGTISDTLDSNSGAVLEVFSMALAAVVDEVDEALDEERDVADSIELMDNDTSIGTINITYVSTDSSTTIVMSASDLNGVSAAGTISTSAPVTAETFAAGDVTLSLDGSASNSDIALSLSNTSFTLSLSEAVTIGNDDDNDDKGDGPPLAGIALVGELAADSLDGGIATGEKMTANVEIKFVALNVEDTGLSFNNDLNLNLEKIALTNLTVTNDAGSTAGLSASLVMNNATSFDALSFLSGEPVVEKSFGFDEFDLSSASTAFEIENFNYLEYFPYGVWFNNAYQDGPHTCAHGEAEDSSYVEYSCIAGDAGLAAKVTPLYDDYKHVSDVTLKYFYSDMYYTSGYVELEVDDMETAESFLDATLSITGRVNLASDPEAVLSIIANKTGIDAGTLTATLAYNGKSMKLVANTTSDVDDITDGMMSFSNAGGTAMTIAGDGEFVTGNVTVSDKEVGTIEDLNGALIMRYNDGTFESL